MNRLVLLVGLLAACPSPAASPPEPTTPEVPPETEARPEPTGELRIDRLNAPALRALLASPSKRVRVVNFWATWCGPCKAEMPALASFARARSDIELWFVNLDHPKAAEQRLTRFIEEQGLQEFRHLRPAPDEPELTDALPDWPDVLPVTLVLEPSGEVRRRVVGAVDEARLNELVGPATGRSSR